MGDMWVTDLTHFLDDNGKLLNRRGNEKIVNHFASIVSDLTANPSAEPRELSVSCRRRPKRKACSGKIHAAFDAGTSNILWFCPICEDRGIIRNWQNTMWDNGGRVGMPHIIKVTYVHGLTDNIEDDSGLNRIVLEGDSISMDLVRAIHDNQLIDWAGEYGEPRVGDPIQVDQLDIEHEDGTTSIRLYNRAIMFFATDEEFYRQVHRVCEMIGKRNVRG